MGRTGSENAVVGACSGVPPSPPEPSHAPVALSGSGLGNEMKLGKRAGVKDV